MKKKTPVSQQIDFDFKTLMFVFYYQKNSFLQPLPQKNSLEQFTTALVERIVPVTHASQNQSLNPIHSTNLR